VADAGVAVPPLRQEWLLGRRIGNAEAGEQRVADAPVYVDADAIDRLRLRDDGIELAQDVYDTVNDRSLEYRYFYTEHQVEIIIAVVLFAELIVVCLALRRSW
jgi:hypothetical protein